MPGKEIEPVNILDLIEYLSGEIRLRDLDACLINGSTRAHGLPVAIERESHLAMGEH